MRNERIGKIGWLFIYQEVKREESKNWLGQILQCLQKIHKSFGNPNKPVVCWLRVIKKKKKKLNIYKREHKIQVSLFYAILIVLAVVDSAEWNKKK